jgi:lipopolysaccharide export system protein LptA
VHGVALIAHSRAAPLQTDGGARYNQKARDLCKIRAFMKSLTFPLFLIAALVLAGGLARAETADRDKPMNVQADALRYDEQKQTSVFSGRVVLTKGSILIRGARIDVRQDAQGHQFGLVSADPGQVAFFRQKREGLDEFIEGEGESIEYDGRADTVRFDNNARLRRYRGATLNDEFSGHVIVYNNSTEVFTIDGSPANAGSSTPAGRVRAILTPKPALQTPATSAVAVTPLRSSGTLGGEKK